MSSMPWTLDARIPVSIAPAGGGVDGASDEAATLVEGSAMPGDAFFVAGETHEAACTCCAGRSLAALALDRLFQDRVHGRRPWFHRVVVIAETDAGRAAIAAALSADALTVARYRVGP